MKTSARVALLGCLLFASVAHAQPPPPPPPPVQVAFFDVLSPYGDWVTLAGYGTVWRPYVRVVGDDFYPYFTGGHWEYTVYGWTWVSDFPWGWVPFHHGRWLFTAEYGWVWVPDDEWAPAWVEWRIGGGYLGWVPIAPPGVLVVFSWYAPRWCWVHARHFHRHDFHRHRLHDPRDEEAAYHHASPVPHQGAEWPKGPPPGRVTEEGGQVEVKTLAAPRRLPEGAVAAERRIAVTTPRDVPGRREPVPPVERSWPRGVPAPVQPSRPTWPERNPVPSPYAPAPRYVPQPVPQQPLPPPIEAPEQVKKKQQRGVPAPALPQAPGPGRKVPPRIPGVP
jgi:hypothetical protein